MVGFTVKVPKSLGMEWKEGVWAVCQNAQNAQSVMKCAERQMCNVCKEKECESMETWEMHKRGNCQDSAHNDSQSPILFVQ